MKDSLAEYNRKRDFTQTAEPKGDIEGATSTSRLLNPNQEKKDFQNFRFVIQKHHASQLHYDFRIEHEGVLKSWAVPKGPPYKSSERHLAMAVEDHPLDYYDFEGVIPEGNYGAGNVIVWDWGNYWVPHAENAEQVIEKINAGFEKGEIKLILNGEKVKGMFALIRFKRAGENAWLMIKDKDEYEGKNFIEDEKSVKSGKTLSEIGSFDSAQDDKNNYDDQKDEKNKTEKLEFISPMKASLGEKPFDDPDYLFEEKLDGYRVIAVIDEEVNLYSRNGEDMNQRFSEIRETLDSIKTPCILDGEVVAYDKKGKSSFQLIQNGDGRNHLTYHVFDILNLNGISTIDLPLIERRKFLKKIIKDRMRVKVTKVVKGKGKELFKKTLKNNEGIIAKKADSKYMTGVRTTEWIKIKNSLREEFVIGGVTNPKGKRSGFGSLIVGYYKKNKLIYVGHIGTGFDDKLIGSLMNSFQKIKRKDSPFDNYSGDRSVQFWVEPIIVCEASFAEWTRDNMIRQATFLGIRTDKLPKQVDKSDSILESIVSNPDKVMFPNPPSLNLPGGRQGGMSGGVYTKLDLAKYYLEISPIILPYLKDRPQNMNRQPDGIKGISFYHKDIEFELPDFVETYDYKRDKPKEQKDGEEIDKEITYILCQNAETLVFMANLGCIEVNPWLSRVENIDRPDFLVFDIDPSGVDFEIVVKVAKDLYKFLEKLEIQPFVKTSGKRGIHLYSFLNQKYSYEESRNFAQLVAKIFEQKYPDIISLERSPKDRKNKIYIDYLQNRKGQTTAAVYSARPTESASVSTPLKFSELNNKLDPLKFDIKNTLKRIEKVGDLWEEIWKRETDLAKSLRLLQKN